MSVLKAKFDKNLCCDHDWYEPNFCKAGEKEKCDKCGAECTRDDNGSIIFYVSGDYVKDIPVRTNKTYSYY